MGINGKSRDEGKDIVMFEIIQVLNDPSLPLRHVEKVSLHSRNTIGME